MSPSLLARRDHNDCALPSFDASDHEVYFDVQSAVPGTFTNPGVLELELYPLERVAEFLWIHFKSDPQPGFRPSHPFEMPFDNRYTTFIIDLIEDEDSSAVVQQLLREYRSAGSRTGKKNNLN